MGVAGKMYDILNVYLENGLQVVLHRIPFVKTMACGLWVRQGSKDEGDSTNGISHLIEHLKLNKENNSNPEFKKLLEEIVSEGVMYNAATTKENTYFYFAGLSSSLEKSILALYYIASNYKFNHEFFENEKKIVNQEISSFYSSFNQIGERTGQALWGNVGIGKIIVGNKTNIENSCIDIVQEIIANSYNPEKSVLVIVGGIEYEYSLDIIQKYFGTWQDKYCEEKADVINSEPGIFFNNKWNGENCVISVGFRTPGFNSSLRYDLKIIADILGGNSLESRLCKEIRIKRGLAYTVGGFLNTYETRGDLGFAVICNNNSIKEVSKIMVNEFAKVKAESFNSEEINRAKKISETKMLLEIDDLPAQLRYLGKSCCYRQIFSIENEIRNIKKVRRDSLDKTIGQVFLPDSMSVAIIGKVDIDEIVPLLQFQ